MNHNMNRTKHYNCHLCWLVALVMLLRCRNAWIFFKLYYIHVNLCAFFLFLYSFIHNDNTQSTLKCGIHIFRRQNEINQYAATASAQIHFTNKKHMKRHTKTPMYGFFNVWCARTPISTDTIIRTTFFPPLVSFLITLYGEHT